VIKKIKAYLTRSEFIKNSFLLVSGTTLSQIFPVLIAPVLSRIYSPEDLGVLAMFMSLSIIFSLVSSGRYELAIVLPKKDSYAINLLALSVYISGIFSVILMIAILFFHDFFVRILETPQIKGWLYLLPVVVFILSGYNALNFYHTRFKNYKIIAKYKIVRSIVTSVIQLAFYFTYNAIFALVGGYSLGQLSGNLTMARMVFKDKVLRRTIKNPVMIALAKRYSNFPKYSMPAGLFNKGSSELPNILITPFFDAATLGFYSYSYRMLTIPSSFIGISVSQVFMQESNSEFLKTGKSIKIFNSVLKKMLLIGIPFFGVLALVSEPLFGFVFGKEWTIAGTYAAILTPLLFVRFLVGSLSSLLYVFEKHGIILFLQIGLFVLALAAFLYSHFMKFNFITFLWWYSISQAIFYVFYLFVIWLVADKRI